MSKIRDKFTPIEAETISTGDASIAVVTTSIGDQYYEETGTAKRDPSDKPNPEAGSKLALARALRNLANTLERQAEGQIKCSYDNRLKRLDALKRTSDKDRTWRVLARDGRYIILESVNDPDGDTQRRKVTDSDIYRYTLTSQNATVPAVQFSGALESLQIMGVSAE